LASPDKADPGQARLGYCPGLDGLRGLSVLAVMAVHAQLLDSGAPASAGVDVFFVLSGFLITTLLAQEWDHSGRISLKRFYARRALRLFPALFVCLLTVTAGYWFIAPRAVAVRNTGDALVALFYSTNWVRAFAVRQPDLFGHTWTLSIEEQFYLVWPVLLIFLLRRTVSRRSLCWWLVLALILVYVERVVLDAAGAEWVRQQFGTDTRADSLLLGCLAGILFQSNLVPRNKLIRGLVRFVAWVGLAAATFLILWPITYFVELGIFDSFVSLAAAFVIFETASSENWLVTRLLSQRWLAYIGKISYGLYLWHHPLFRLVQSTSWSPRIVLAAGLGATLAITLASYYLLERPFLRRKARLAA